MYDGGYAILRIISVGRHFVIKQKKGLKRVRSRPNFMGIYLRV